MEMVKKSLGMTVLSDDIEAGAEVEKGHVSAVVCTYGVIDKDGDVVVKGAIPEGSPVILSAYNHSAMTGQTMPVGKGVIKTVGEEAVLEGEFFMDTAAGRDAFRTVKALAKSGLGEWSWGFIPTEQEPGDYNGKKANFIKKTYTFEASFVAMGAGVNTRTLEAKSTAVEKRTFTAEEREKLAREGKALPDGSFPIVNVEDLKNAIQAIGRAKDPAAAKRHIKKRARALGHEDLIPDEWSSGKKFAEEGADVLASLKSFRARAAEVLTMRQEKGKHLSEETMETVKDIAVEMKALLDELTAPQVGEKPAATEEQEEIVLAEFNADERLEDEITAFLLNDSITGEDNE